jgi:hypothetical protein
MPSPASSTVDTRNRDSRSVLARSISKLFDLWHLESADRLALLGLNESNRTALQRYAKGEPLASSRDLMDRAGHLLGIHKSLKLLYPANKEIVSGWMSSPNQKFGGTTPVEVARKWGLPGLVMVRGTLDRMRG